MSKRRVICDACGEECAGAETRAEWSLGRDDRGQKRLYFRPRENDEMRLQSPRNGKGCLCSDCMVALLQRDYDPHNGLTMRQLGGRFAALKRIAESLAAA